MKMNWTEMVKARLKELSVTQEALAEKIGVTPGGLGHWLNGRRDPSLEIIAKILKELRLDKLILNSDGSLEYPSLENTTPSPELAYKNSFPVISAVQAGAWTEACEPYSLNEVDEFLFTTEKANEHSFWLKVKGDSMTSNSSPSFPEGTAVLVDPCIEPESGKLVIAKLSDVNEATFKRLIIDAGQKYLKPLNPDYPMLPINGNCKIIGVVIDAKMKLF
ncbi:putative phage repressor protein CI [Aliivibrio wodanis]|jgi:SOS-response transcriptional repressor LexA|uniref:Putative phage repressor protein CI n=1 Tax=Aliivibrio wodanis TaxID=80852 RepID=A0A090ILD4_9GAMM|nr:putative phage repressor protein CI [Aliivibrio wodanis]